jgi:hypothetical protein
VSVNEPIVARRKVSAGSNRSFGIVFAIVFAVVATWPIVSGKAPRLWAAAIALAFAGVAFAAPHWLGPLNRIWFRLGLLLHRVVNPLVMGVIYFGTVVPTGMLLRALGKDLLRLRREPAADSYWIVRQPPGPEPGSMSRQF